MQCSALFIYSVAIPGPEHVPMVVQEIAASVRTLNMISQHNHLI